MSDVKVFEVIGTPFPKKGETLPYRTDDIVKHLKARTDLIGTYNSRVHIDIANSVRDMIIRDMYDNDKLLYTKEGVNDSYEINVGFILYSRELIGNPERWNIYSDPVYLDSISAFVFGEPIRADQERISGWCQASNCPLPKKYWYDILSEEHISFTITQSDVVEVSNGLKGIKVALKVPVKQFLNFIKE